MVKQELEGRIMSIQLKLSGILQVIFYNFIMSCLRIPTKPLRNLLKDSQVVTGKKKKKNRCHAFSYCSPIHHIF